MRSVCVLIAALALGLLSGCIATTKRSTVAFVEESGGSLSVWNADMTAAVGYPDGRMCMQRALAVKAIDAEGTAKVSDALLQLASAVKTANVEGKDLASITGSVKETVSLMTTTTERTAFLDLGLFYVCQLAANGSLTDTQTAEVVRALTIAAASITTTTANATLEKLQQDKITPGDNTATPKASAAAAKASKTAPSATIRPAASTTASAE